MQSTMQASKAPPRARRRAAAWIGAVLLTAVAAGALAPHAALPPAGAESDEAGERAALLALIAPRPGERIADLGCGSGTWTVPLARAVGDDGRVLAVDIDARQLARARERIAAEGVTNVDVIQSLPDDPMLPPERLDAVFLNDVIDYVERRALAGFLGGIRDALKPTGRLILRDPNGGVGRVIAECHRAGFDLVEAKIPLHEAPQGSFGDSWYALKLRVAEGPQHSLLPRLGRPDQRRTRLLLVEELFRAGLLDRAELRAAWERIGAAAPEPQAARLDLRDLVTAAEATGALDPELAGRVRARIDAR